MSNVKPITPGEIAAIKTHDLHDEIIAAWNILIGEHFRGGRSVVSQEDAITALRKATGAHRPTVFSRGWLEIEEVFSAAGWHVTYDKPGPGESYDPTFTFKPKRGQ